MPYQAGLGSNIVHNHLPVPEKDIFGHSLFVSIHVKSSKHKKNRQNSKDDSIQKSKNVFPGISPGNLPAVSEKQVGMDGQTDGRNIMPLAEQANGPVS